MVIKRKQLNFVGYSPDALNESAFSTSTIDALTTRDVWPLGSGFASVADMTAVGVTTLDGITDLGSFSTSNHANTVFNFLGGATKLYKLAQSTTAGAITVADVSRTTGGAYSATGTWEFAEFGDLIVACNVNDATQKFSKSTGTNFQPLGGGSPQANHIDVVLDFLVMGDVYSGSTRYPARVQWCAFNNAANWTVDATTQADYQDLPDDGGVVQKVVGGDYGYVFQERCIWQMTYAGTPIIFQFDKVSNGVGCYAPGSVVKHEDMVFFLAADGFYVLQGGKLTNIGENQVNRQFFSELLITSKHLMRAAVDPLQKVVLWAYPDNQSGGNIRRALAYNWKTGRWSVLTAASFPVAMNGFLSWINSSPITGNANQPLVTANKVPNMYQVPRQKALFGWGANGALYAFKGNYAAGKIATEHYIPSGDLMDLESVRLVADSTSSAFSAPVVAAKTALNGAFTLTTMTAAVDESYTARVAGKEFYFVANVGAGGFANARGVDVKVMPSAQRR